MQGQFTDEAADALDFDAVEDDQREYRQGHAHGCVRISRRYGTEREVLIARDQDRQLRNPVNRDQVDGVHQEHPHENGQRQRCDYCTATVETVFYAAINEFHQYFNEVLQCAWLTGSCLLGRHAEYEDEDQTNKQRPAEGIDVERPKAH